MYKVTFLSGAEKSFALLDRSIQLRLAENADRVIHHPLKAMPNDLRGLCRLRVGDYRLMDFDYSYR